MKTRSANLFANSVLQGWDSREPWETTAREGLSEADAATLHELCKRHGGDYDQVEREVMAFIREEVGRKVTPDNFYDHFTSDYACSLVADLASSCRVTPKSVLVERLIEWCERDGYVISPEDAAIVLTQCIPRDA